MLVEKVINNNVVTAKHVIIATRYPIINFPGFHFIKMYSEASYLMAVDTNSSLFKGMYINAFFTGYRCRFRYG